MAEYTLLPHWVKTARVIPAHSPREHGTVKHPHDQLYIALIDYQTQQGVPTNALTLVLTHGNSFHKELWEIIIPDLICHSPLDRQIKRVIAIDAVNHGDSAVHNDSKLGDRAFWPDVSHDILKALDELEVTGPVVGIGHSFGGGTLLHAAMMAPTRFTATILIEPILFPMKKTIEAVAKLTMRRRDRWETLEQVRTSFTRGFPDWHPAQLDIYVNHGTRYVTPDDAPGYWALKTPKVQETAVYLAAPYPQILELLAKSTQRHDFIFGGQSKVVNKEHRETVRGLLPRRASLQFIEGADHLVPMTHPAELGLRLRALLVEICRLEVDPTAKI